jgi:hypothetical protein
VGSPEQHLAQLVGRGDHGPALETAGVRRVRAAPAGSPTA